jgi:hypothetical protein
VTYQGVVKGNVVVLEEGAQLPEGARVAVRMLEEPLLSRDEAFEHLLNDPIMRPIGIDEIIQEDKREREVRATWLISPQQDSS